MAATGLALLFWDKWENVIIGSASLPNDTWTILAVFMCANVLLSLYIDKRSEREWKDKPKQTNKQTKFGYD